MRYILYVQNDGWMNENKILFKLSKCILNLQSFLYTKKLLYV